MSIPVSGRPGAAPFPSPSVPEPRAVVDGRRGPRFAEILRGEPAPMRDAFREAVRDISRGERTVSSVISAARRGKVFSNEELLAVQAGVYRYTQELELASKLVDKATGAVKQTLQSQQ